jgi:outer membrane lipoprotein-sorting protein/peroxiredoxin
MTNLQRHRITLSVGLAAATVAAFLALPVRAQETTAPPETPKPAEAAKPADATPAAKIDPEAKKIIDKMTAAHQALTAYSGTLDFSAKQGERSQTSSSAFSFVRPNKINVRTTSPTAKGTRTIVSDGKQVYMTNSEDSKSYLKDAALPDERNIARALSQSGGGGTGLFLLLLTDPKASDKVLGPAVQSLELLPDSQMGSVDVKVVKAIMSQPPKPVITFSIGKDDNLLRGITISAGEGGQGLFMEEKYSDVKANPTLADSTFTFTPPPGAKEEKPAPEETPYDKRLKVGAAPLPFSGTDLQGKPVRLDAYRGKVVLIDFWATWCGPCVAEVPTVVGVYNKYRGQGFDIIGVSLDEAGDKAKLTSFAESHKMPWRQIYDGKGWQSALAQAYGVQAIPFTLLVGRDGKIAAVSPRGEDLEPAVKAALAKK